MAEIAAAAGLVRTVKAAKTAAEIIPTIAKIQASGAFSPQDRHRAQRPRNSNPHTKGRMVGRPGAADQKLNAEYQVCSLWAQFHLDSVIAAIKFKKVLGKEIQDVLCDGLRMTVNAYAVMKEALALRVPHHPEVAPSGGSPGMRRTRNYWPLP